MALLLLRRRRRRRRRRALAMRLLVVFILELVGVLVRVCDSSNTLQLCERGVAEDTANGPLVPAFFIFGDSIVDPGNNNRLPSLSKVNYYPYGMDFPGNVPTGRYSNGYNPADFFAVRLGLSLIPAYNNPAAKGKRLLQGVNFASGGSGILPNTGRIYGQSFSLEDQINNFQDVKQEVTMLLGEAAAQDLVGKAAYMILSGSNDWLLSYFAPVLPHNNSAEELQGTLIKTLLVQIETIYSLGGRKIAVSGLPPLGCCPSLLELKKSNGICVEDINLVCSDYNKNLLSQVLALNDKLPDATIAYIDIYSLLLTAAQNPEQFGFKTGNTGCCGIGEYKGLVTCLPGVQPCDNVEDHLYWDAFHPTQNFYPYLVDLLWNNGPPYVYPTSLRHILTSR